ncbi:hypothetical protein [Pseudanabaena sp. FACHB-2040]|uniref:hypothetical protein n=1 Tax=Pseudanabaena sp. FACHB-2040 TaxID=2692859 RepID=UPI001684B7CA|nr:hypothetical protein [Pseudanabaena sp. FACHB-2040]MBD2259007.1 hypothetical protein [Pseudanabaena sp. FACHB-2040]
MRRLTAITLASLASLSLSGCGFFNSLFNRGQDDVVVEPIQTPLPDETVEQTDEEFVQPLIPAAPSAAAIASAELIQSTDPNERIQQISTSRPDPYATVPIPPRPTAAPRPATSPQGTGTGATGAGATGAGATGAGATGGRAGAGTATGAAGGTRGGTGTAPGATAGRPGTVPTPGGSPVAVGPGGSPTQALPALPQPQIATSVAVTGVVQVGGETYAIIQAPDEPTSRYVRTGQRLANGQVLVKRIEMRGGVEPVVILEENGIEVARPVGSTGGPVEETPTAAAGTPVQALAVPPLPQS